MADKWTLTGTFRLEVAQNAAQPEEHTEHPASRPAHARFYLLPRDAPPQDPVPTAYCRNLDDAAETFLMPRLRMTLPFPPLADDDPVASSDLHAPETFKLAIASGSMRYLIGRADWPQHQRKTVRELWSTFGPIERMDLERKWRGMTRSLDERDPPA